MGSNVIVGSSWGKVSMRCSSWGQKVISPSFYVDNSSFQLEINLLGVTKLMKGDCEFKHFFKTKYIYLCIFLY
jgi:hypothetical protein